MPSTFDSPKTLLGQEAKMPLPLEGAGVDLDVVDVVVEVPSPEIACKVRKRRSLFCAMFNLVHEL